MNKSNLEKLLSPRTTLAEYSWNKITEKYGYEPLSEASLKNLAEANDQLKHNSVVIYINHTSSKDVQVALTLAMAYMPNAKRFFGPAGMKHYDIRRDPKNAIQLQALRVLNVRAVPIVQRDDRATYSEKKRQKLSEQYKKITMKLLPKAGTIFGIAPEGTRNQKDRTLQKAFPGIGNIETFATNVSYLPIALVHENQTGKPHIVVGKPLQLNEIPELASYKRYDLERAQAIADSLMYRLALLLPAQMRGYYAVDNRQK